MANHLDRVVEAGLQDLTAFVYRDRLREAEGLDDPASRAGAIHLFKHLKYHGYPWDDEVVRVWAEAHAWTPTDAATLAEYARGVRDGVRYHTQPDPFGPHAIRRWRETAAERGTGPELPDEVDGGVPFFKVPCDGDDYLYDAGWHTFPGRMAAYCPHRGLTYRISKYELPTDLPDITSAWVAGYLAGSLPGPPDSAWDEEGNERPLVMERWTQLGDQYRHTGWWPPDADAEAFLQGDGELPLAPSPPPWTIL